MEKHADKSSLMEGEDVVVVSVPRRSSRWVNLGVLCSAVAFVIWAGACYLGYDRLIKVNQDVVMLTTRLDNQLQQDQAAIATLQQNLSDAQKNLQTTLAAQQQVIGELRHAQQGKQENWRIAEAEYLTNLANDTLQLGDNLPQVIALLQAADEKMRDLSDATVLPIRKALAADMAALQAVPTVDLTGIYLQLSALNGQVDKLPLPNNRPEAGQEATASTNDKPLSWWRQGLQHSWSVLRQIVVVRYNKPGERPFIPPDQQTYLYQNLHATLEQSLSAIVHRQAEIYRASLQQAEAWIRQYFLLDAPATQAELTGLAKLQTVTLRPTLPDISASLQAFRDYFTENNAVEKPAATSASQS